MKRHPSLLCTNGTRGSTSLREIARGLSTMLRRKVFRTTRENPRRKQFKYGQPIDKLRQYQWFEANNIPSVEYTADAQVAEQWLRDDYTVFGRRLLNASCGRGIVVMEKDEDGDYAITPCPVYTKYKKKKREFRIHIFKNNIVAIVEKKRKRGFEGQRDTKIRNLENGYVFVQNTGELPDGLSELALRAAAVTDSDFKGVDVGFNERNNELFVIEVNSAPGIQGSNIGKYLNEIIKYV